MIKLKEEFIMIGFGDKTILDFFDFADFIYSDGNTEIHQEK